MIESKVYVKVGFDKEGKRRIEEAIETIRDVIASLNKTQVRITGGIEFDLERAEATLNAIVDGVYW